MDNWEPKSSLELHFTEILGFHFWKRVNTNEKLRKWVFCHGLSRFDHVMRSDAHEPYLSIFRSQMHFFTVALAVRHDQGYLTPQFPQRPSLVFDFIL
jgi:hypothetical protein